MKRTIWRDLDLDGIGRHLHSARYAWSLPFNIEIVRQNPHGTV
ncbi:hypothetical protein [Sinorhizobium medicae]|nr:hypothetical protein [Sinorhizobium medicae]